MIRFEGLAHPSVEQIEPFKPTDLDAAAGRAGMSVRQLARLNMNENPFGPAPQVPEALADFDGYQFYPDYGPLRRAVADYAEVTPDQLVLSNGADEMIDMLIRTFVAPGQVVVICPPTFVMYKITASVNRCQTLSIPCQADLSLDVPAIEAAVRESSGNVRLLFIASPGNPSGQAVPLDVIQRLLNLPLLVAVDEAYIEFGGQSAVRLLQEHENLAIIRTFSKWAGLAGMRLGYGMLAPRLARTVERIRPPFNVNAAVVVAALATLADLDAVQANLDRLIAERESLQVSLAAFSWMEPLPSQTNFILCRLRGQRTQTVIEALAEEGILVLSYENPALAGCIRIGVGRPDQNQRVLAVLRKLDQGDDHP